MKKFTGTKKFIFDIFFPAQCIMCGTGNAVLCDQCYAKIILEDNYFCPVCRKKSFYGFVCKKCFGSNVLDGVWAIVDYKNVVIKKTLHVCKFFGVVSIMDYYEKLIKKYFLKLPPLLYDDFDIIIPVPLHKKRRYARGFNQSFLLSRVLEGVVGSRVDNSVLVRTKHTLFQTSLNTTKRKTNVKNAFSLYAKKSVKGKNIILVDDIMTTGSTLEECARVLKKGGAKKVWAVVLAHSETGQ